MDPLAKMILANSKTSNTKRGEFGNKLLKYFSEKSEAVKNLQSPNSLGKYDTTVVSNVKKLHEMEVDNDLCMITAYHWFLIEPEIRKKMEEMQEVIYQTDVYLRPSIFDKNWELYFSEGLGDPFTLIHYKFDEEKSRLFFVSLSPGSEIDRMSDRQLDDLKKKINSNIIKTYYFSGKGGLWKIKGC